MTIIQKVYLDEANRIKVSCPQCKKIRDIDATPFLKKKGLIRLTFHFKCKFCDCGHKDCRDCPESDCPNCNTDDNTNIITIERRRFFRKKVDLPGELFGENKQKYPIRVLDLSRTGIRTKVLKTHDFRIAQKLLVEFTLDDAKSNVVKKLIVIRNIDGKMVAGEFTETDEYNKSDKAIGFYLMK